MDNPNSRMQKIVDNLRVSAEDAERGIIRLDPDKTDGRIVEIRVGRKRDEKTGMTSIPSPGRPFTSRCPEIREANGYVHPPHPDGGATAESQLSRTGHLDFTVIEDGIEKEPERVHIGDLPVMVEVEALHPLQGEHGGGARAASRTSTARSCIQAGEDPMDPGGYFIIGGTERVLITLEDLAPNRVMVEFNERYGTKLEVAKVFSQKEGHRALTLVEKKRDGMLMVTVPAASGQIPLVALMKALGMENDEEIYNAIVSTDDMAQHRLR